MSKRERNMRIRTIRMILCFIIVFAALAVGCFALSSKLFSHLGAAGLTDDEKYNIDTQYEKAGLDVLDLEIDSYVLERVNVFKSRLKDAALICDGAKYDFLANVQTYRFKNVVSSVVTTYEFYGGNTYEIVYKTFMYDAVSKTALRLTDMMQSERSIDEVARITKETILASFKGEQIIFDEAEVVEYTKVSDENYKNVFLSKEGLNIISEYGQVGAASDGEKYITIPYGKLKTVLKEEYLSDDVIKEIQDDKIAADSNKKYIALTFDDGPNNATTMLLVDGLKRYNAKATFFVLGSRVNANEAAIKYASDSGFEIGSHTYSHKDLKKLSDDEVKREIKAADDAIYSVTKKVPALVRTPYGSFDDRVKKLCGKPIILWNADTEDWKTKDADKVYKAIMRDAKDGAIIIMHDIYRTSVDGCLAAVADLKAKGYEFVTISRLAQIKGVKLQAGQTYRFIR